MPERVLVSWSGGKDSALALGALRRDPGVEVAGLLTAVDPQRERVAAHEVEARWVRAQARALSLPLHEVAVPRGAGDAAYEAAHARVLAPLRGAGVEAVAFGDLFLADIRRFREALLARLGLAARFPLWRRDTRELARAFLEAGHRAWVVCVDLRQLDAAFAGRPYDARLLADLPEGADPCGEAGELHTFVFDGPGFAAPVPVAPGAVRREGRFAVADLTPAPPGPGPRGPRGPAPRGT